MQAGWGQSASRSLHGRRHGGDRRPTPVTEPTRWWEGAAHTGDQWGAADALAEGRGRAHAQVEVPIGGALILEHRRWPRRRR